MFGEVGIRQSQWWGFMFHHSLFEKMMKEKKAKAEEKGKLGYDQREKAKKRKAVESKVGNNFGATPSTHILKIFKLSRNLFSRFNLNFRLRIICSTIVHTLDARKK